MSTEVIRRRSSLIFASARSQHGRRALGRRPANRYWLAEPSGNSHKLTDVRHGAQPTMSYLSGILVGLHSGNQGLGCAHRALFVFAEESFIKIWLKVVSLGYLLFFWFHLSIFGSVFLFLFVLFILYI